MISRMVGALWVVAGASLVSAAMIVAVLGPEGSRGAPGAFVLAVGSIGALAFAGAAVGLGWQFRERLGRLGAVAASVAVLGMLLGVIEVASGFVLST